VEGEGEMDSKNKEFYKKIGAYIWSFIKGKVWYSFLLLISSLYIWKYRFEINQLKELDVKNLIFILWIFLLAFPLFSEMEILGVKVKKEVKKATEEVKGSLKDIQSQITQLQLNNSVSNRISIENTPLPSEKRLEEMQKSVSDLHQNISESNADGSTEKSVFLFKTRLKIEVALREIYEKIGNEGYYNRVIGLGEMAKLLNQEKIISETLLGLIIEVSKITNRGVHGEIVSDEYIEFVKSVCPGIIQQLDEISKKI
jgi:hypothetical protein